MGRNISEPIGNFFRNLFNPFPEINSNSSRESSGSVVNVESLGYIDDNGEFHYWNNYDGPRLDVKTIGGDPFSGSEQITMQEIQRIGELILGENISKSDAGDVQLAADLLVIAVSKGKSTGRLGK